MKRSWGVLIFIKGTLRWRHNGRDSVSNHQRLDCLLNRLFRRRSKKTSKLRVTGLCAGNSPGTDEFPEQMASNAENVSIWWRHHVLSLYLGILAPRQMLFTDHAPVRNESKLVIQRFWIKLCSKYCFLHLIHFHWLVVAWWRHLHGWPSTQPGTCTQPCPIVHTAVPPLFTQPCPGRTMSTAMCIYVAGLCAGCPAV